MYYAIVHVSQNSQYILHARTHFEEKKIKNEMCTKRTVGIFGYFSLFSSWSIGLNRLFLLNDYVRDTHTHALA